ncbi:MAG: hypothetical protein K8F92_14785 [Hyphomicrobium sp.]|uniref:hypothetical protein n=1 Tax=Hyphomicrobium sp. TaxID=82 RepID=UPI0013207EB0|nr:hypothetical protein [Hyphomicrobium sp.]KAB2942944.1 MAG: hypothetical protein F9K20_05645 [Hyphomicrobium sp.]MBZ0210898.1 hypothetical protein [Hyphomicrobium sp.]
MTNDELKTAMEHGITSIAEQMRTLLEAKAAELFDIVEAQGHLLVATIDLLIDKGVLSRTEIFEHLERTTRDAPVAQQRLLAIVQQKLASGRH